MVNCTVCFLILVAEPSSLSLLDRSMFTYQLLAGDDAASSDPFWSLQMVPSQTGAGCWILSLLLSQGHSCAFCWPRRKGSSLFKAHVIIFSRTHFASQGPYHSLVTSAKSFSYIRQYVLGSDHLGTRVFTGVIIVPSIKRGALWLPPTVLVSLKCGLGSYSFGDFSSLQSWVDLKVQNEGEAERTPELEADKSWLTSKGFLAYQPAHCPFKAICSLLSCIINLISVIALNYVISVNTWRIP